MAHARISRKSSYNVFTAGTNSQKSPFTTDAWRFCCKDREFGMFALYYDQDSGRLTWIASCQDVRSARNVAQVYSTGEQLPVVFVYNAADGSTRRCCMFRDGLEIALDCPFENPDTESGESQDAGDDSQRADNQNQVDPQDRRDRQMNA